MQGDVTDIYTSGGNSLAKYGYEAYGKCTVLAGTNDYNLANANPIRYRGYYFDAETGFYCLGARYYDPQARRFISPDDTAYIDPESVNGLNLYCYCNNDPVMHKQGPGSYSGLIISSSISVGGSSSITGSSGTSSNVNPSAPCWLSTAVGAIPDFILGMQYLAAHGMHSKFAYATNTRYMHPIMGGTWRWFPKSSSNFGTIAQGAFKQILTGDARAAFGAIAKSVGNVVGVNTLINFGFNLYENNWQIDSAMLKDTAIDTAIGVGSYYLAAGTMSLITAGVVAVGFSVPGIIVIGGIIILGVGFEHLIRSISGYWE